MPVPVPVYLKQVAHPVIKINHPSQSDSESSVFQHLTHSLPLPPQGPPPSLASREEWISSLPDWRRNKRRVGEDDFGFRPLFNVQGFNEGLTVADNAAVIKGAPAQASIPPVRDTRPLVGSREEMYLNAADVDDDMNGCRGWTDEEDQYAAEYSPVDSMASDRQSAESSSDMAMDYPARGMEFRHSFSAVGGDYERGVFSPVQEDLSPDVYAPLSPAVDDAEPGSSPIGPATPFAEFIDNAFAQERVTLDPGRNVEQAQAHQYYNHDGYHAACYQCQTYQAEQPLQQTSVADTVVTPMATTAYKKLAAPLSEWIASYVWKVCTTGMRLPTEYAQPS